MADDQTPLLKESGEPGSFQPLDKPVWTRAPTSLYEVNLNEPEKNRQRGYPDNYLQTAKYSAFTFAPLNLFEQFVRNKSNFYFLLSALVSLIPDISPVSPLTTVTPLVFVLGVAMIKDGYEDWTKHVADREANSAQYKVLRRGGVLETTGCAYLQSGDIVYISRNQGIPADLVVLATPDPRGTCYIETSNLDGETNLKRRCVPQGAGQICGFDGGELSRLSGRLVFEEPNASLYDFEGTLFLSRRHEETAAPLTKDQVMLRGSVLRKTKGVFGVVVYAGRDTKMCLNLRLVSSKFSRAQYMLNRAVLAVFLANILMVIGCASMAAHLQGKLVSKMPYMSTLRLEAARTVGLRAALTWFVLLTYLIPISLFVTLEFVRLAQAGFMMLDINMASDPNNVKETGMRARSSNLNEELGRVGHIFSDKTGTLTCNEMILSRWSIGGALYDKDMNLVENDLGTAPSEAMIKTFFRDLCVCNTVVSEDDGGTVHYEAESPDEGALVTAAASCGCVLNADESDQVVLDFMPSTAFSGGEHTTETHHKLASLPFTSARMRMSVITEDHDGEIWCFTKGADAALLPLLNHENPHVKTKTLEHLDLAARDGLRTLLVAAKRLTPAQYTEWKGRFDEASTTVGGERQRALDAVFLDMERDLTLLGATAVEDRLQDEVPRTIRDLVAGGINVWVLTGDKLETAVNIGYSSSLLEEGVRLDFITLDGETQALDRAAQTQQIRSKLIQSYTILQSGKEKGACAAIVDGQALRIILTSNDLSRLFLDVAECCRTLICCRVSPIQKAEVVRLVREDQGSLAVLAIGDGANDVSMIQEADVGIGVIGKEGTQAVRASDYALHEFRFLAPLIFVHGRWSYYRVCNVIQYSFYKNIAFVFPLVLFGFFSAFSGQIIYDDYVLMTINIFWLSLPPLVMGIWDRDVDAKVLAQHPILYAEFLREDLFTMKTLCGWVIMGLYHGTLLFVAANFGTGWYDVVGPDGRVSGLWFKATMTGTIGVVVLLLKSVLVIKWWNVFCHLAVWGSIVLYFVFLFTYMDAPMWWLNARMYLLASTTLSHPILWFVLVGNVVASLLPDVVYGYVMLNYFPRLWQQYVIAGKRGSLPEGLG